MPNRCANKSLLEIAASHHWRDECEVTVWTRTPQSDRREKEQKQTLFTVLFDSNRTIKVAIMFWMKQLWVPDILPWFWSEMVKSNRRSSVVWKEEQFVVSGSAVVIQSSLLSVGSHCSAPFSALLLLIMAPSSFLWSWTWQVSRSERLTPPAGSSLCWPDFTLRDTTEITICPLERWLSCNLHLKDVQLHRNWWFHSTQSFITSII